jgi:hypothetical protein
MIGCHALMPVGTPLIALSKADRLMHHSIDPVQFRQHMGQIPTGVCVITTRTVDGAPFGVTRGGREFRCSTAPSFISNWLSKTVPRAEIIVSSSRG